ncbi:hypothetical protein [Embleya sp. NPDC059237]|uniref:hypothetical protein n=1 Tax=Embleya sp. NPDC059237 TaxID=3346784 RepID=UPI0036A62EBD
MGTDTAGPENDHAHGGFGMPPENDAGGRPVDHVLLGSLVGAAMDGCVSCQDPLLTLLVEDPVTTSRVIELACIATQRAFGGLPASMTEDDVPGLSHPAFRRAARAGLDGANDALFATVGAMSPGDRRGAANTAIDTLAGFLGLAGPH